MKKIMKLLLLTIFLFNLTGCLKTEELDNAEIYTTVYPIEYLVNELYGYNSEIKSIYPNDINIKEYTLSNRKIKKYSKTDLFVYNGLSEEKKIAANFVNNNSKLKIIDVSEGLAIKYSYEELWLNPANYLMLAQNIKKGLNTYIESTIIKSEIDKNYENLKLTLTEFETTLKLLSQNGKNKTLIVSKDYFKFLENYGFEVISLEETDELNNDIINRAKKLIKDKTNSFIFVSKEESIKENYSKTLKSVKESGAEYKVLNTMTILSTTERDAKDDYKTIMNSNIESLKEEIYN